MRGIHGVVQMVLVRDMRARVFFQPTEPGGRLVFALARGVERLDLGQGEALGRGQAGWGQITHHMPGPFGADMVHPNGQRQGTPCV